MSGGVSATATDALRVLWIESGQHTSESGLAWLRQRMQDFQSAQRGVTLIDQAWSPGSGQASLGDRQRLRERVDCGVERIVVACVNRLDYPVELIDFLQHTCPEVPLALASDSWWDGRRRTGLPTPGQLSLPWYRWWDGWVDWLEGRSPTLFEAAPAEWPVLDGQVPAVATGMHGLIVGNCQQTTAAWALVASTAGHTTECISWHRFQAYFSTQWTQPLPHWVLWDDTSLDTIPVHIGPKASKKMAASREENNFSRCASDGAGEGGSADADEAAIQSFFEQLSELSEQRTKTIELSPPQMGASSSVGMLGIVAVSMPRAAWATRLCASPGCELLVKPAGGQGLMRLLSQVAAVQGAFLFV